MTGAAYRRRDHVDEACIDGQHAGCTGYVGAYETHMCQCRCHDARYGRTEATR